MAEIAGLTLITPSSVAGSGVSLSGAKVVFTAAGTISVNGVFDGTYDNYLVVCQTIGSSVSFQWNMRLRASGTDATASNYARQYLIADDTSVIGSRTTATDRWIAGSPSSNGSGHYVYVYGPALAQPTAQRSVVVGGFTGAYVYEGAGTHSLSSVYDGFTWYNTTNTGTGSLTVYGLSQ